MKNRRRLQAGVSMLEVMITLFIVMIGLLVVMASFIAIGKSHRYGERMETATVLARREMERIRNRPYASIQNEIGAYHEYNEHPDFRHETNVRDMGTLKEITLRVFFENDRRRAEVRTYVSSL